MVELTPLDILNGVLSIIMVVISVSVGMVLIYKYAKYKRKPLLYMGIALILITEVWFTHSLALILILTTGKGLPPEIFFIIAFILIPWALLALMMVITELINKEKLKLIVSIYVLFGIVYTIFFFVFLFTNIQLIGELSSPIDPHTGLYLSLYLLFVLTNIFITGYLFFRESRKSPDPEIRLKGTLYFLASTSFAIGSILDTLALNVLFLIIVRIILILSTIEVYGAFVLPNWMKKLFLKKK
ncbi:MAG: hypothetical protein GF353_22840 [Candidatus Lokiarchaeota archaeon]|nr:hypothetical protein [Candidatus Lokiarchaeota archaeon]